MSYCRWSTDGFQCDLYVYEAEDGHCIHVASSRWIERAPTIPWKWAGTPIIGKLVFKLYQRHYRKWVETRTKVDIGLKYDGESFYCMTAGECAWKCESLKEMGYNVPQYVIDELYEESKEEADE